jgi:gliding motility-associated-like protein
MKLFKKLLSGILCCALPALLFCQDFSNKGKDFWIGYGNHVRMFNSVPYPQTACINNVCPEKMQLYITSDVNTTGSVEILGIGFSQPFSVTANQITTIDIPRSAALNDQGTFNKGIHVTAQKAVVVYSFIYVNAISGATVCLPTNTLGREYYSVNFKQLSNEPNSHSYFFVVATDTGTTTVEITPSATLKNGAPAGVPFTITLTQGQIYQALGQVTGTQGVDLTGSKIQSLNTGAGCKRIGVFCGSGKISIGCNDPSVGSSDNLYQQIYPTGVWGKTYITVPPTNNGSNFQNNYYRIIRPDPTAIVSLNGIPIPAASFINGFYYQFTSTTTNVISSSMPILVAQYFPTTGGSSATNCGNSGIGDPEMIYLNPVEQTVTNVTLNSMQPATNTNLTTHFLNVVLRNVPGAINSFRIDGVSYPSSFSPVLQDPNYAYARIGVPSQGHTVTCDSGFNIISYGLGSAESYGYSGGTNLKDLYQFVSIVNQYATVNFPATCRNTPFYFRIVFPYQPTQIQWVFGPALNAMGIADVTISSPVFDSTWVVNGRQVYRYSLPSQYNITAVGTYPIKVIANNPTPDGCSGVQEIDYDLQVFNPPSAAFNFTTNGCVTSPVSFFDQSNTGGRPIIQWNWNFGDAATSTQQNPTHTYPAPGSYFASLSVITDVGCVSDTAVQNVILSQLPIANFGMSTPRCAGKVITFTDSSTVTGGSALAKWYWDFGDGSPVVIATSNAPQTHVYAVPGSYNVTLKVETTSGCQSFVFTRPLMIYSDPTAAFSSGGGVCLPQGTATFTNNSTMPDGTGPLLTYLWNFGDGNTSTTVNPVHNYTTGGPFTVTLIATSNNGCIDTVAQVLSNIYAQPDAAFTVDSVESCYGGTFNFTDQSTAANSTVTQWFWDFGDATTSTLQNPTKQYAATGTYTVKLYINSAAGCRSDTATMDVTVLQLPTVSFTNSSPVCEQSAVQFTSTSVPNAGSISQYNWTVNGNATGGNNSVINYTPATAGSYTIALSVATDKGCTSQANSSLTVNPKPVSSFNLPNVCLPAGNASFTSTSTVASGTITNYLWNFGNSQTATTQTATTIYTGTGPFNVSLIVTSNNGCSDTTMQVLNTIFAQPQAAFNAPAEVCFGTPITFTDQSTAPNSTVTQWLWNFGDATTSTAQNPVKNYAAAGTYTVTLTVTSAVGCPSTTATRTVVVNPLPTANFTTSSPACATRDITFTDASAANAGTLVKWTWNFGDGNTAVNTSPAPFIHNYANPGTYNVTLQVETNKGCISTVLTRPITINVLPVAGFISPEVCLTDPAAPFIDTSKITTGNITAWLWNFGDPNANAGNPNTSVLQNPSHMYSVVGNYTATLIVTSNNGCTDTISQTFTVNGSIPVANFNVQNANALCSNKDVVIADASTVDFGSIVKTEIYWDWTNDPTIKTTDNTPSPGKLYNHTYPEFGSPATRTVTIRMISYSGITCLNVLTKTITLLATPSLRFDPVNDICSNDPSFQITQASITNGLPGTGVFSGNGVNATGLFNPNTAGAGIHTIRYTFTGANTCSNYIERTITVNPTPLANAGPDKVVLEGGQVTLTPALNTGFPITYLWSPATGLSNPNLPNPIASPADDIIYTLRVTSDKGCTTTDQVFVKVLKKPAIPNIFSPNGDGIHDKWVIGFLDTYPGCTVEIFNRYGQRIYYSIGYSDPWDGTVNGKPVPVGTYYYIVDPKNGRQKMTGYVDIVR